MIRQGRLFTELLTYVAAKKAMRMVSRKVSEMTEEERRVAKARLIVFGFWGADEPGDPTTDVHDAGALHDRLQAKLAEGAYLVTEVASDHSLTREVVIFHIDQVHNLGAAPNYIEAITLAALALPEFLRQHPECAAEDRATAEVEIGEGAKA
jgi:hypothetical protein